MSTVYADYYIDDPVSQAQQGYKQTLVRWGLEDMSKAELDRARAALGVQSQSRITSEDITFQAACTRLQARADLTVQALEDAVRQLLQAEFECDQAEWERSCSRTAAMVHSHYMIPTKTGEEYKAKGHPATGKTK